MTTMSVAASEEGKEAELAATRKKMYAALQTSLIPIARIPWIGMTTPDSSLLFENSKLYQVMHTHEQFEIALSQLYRLVNEVALFYLASR
jgi:hypothetical protein